jgi:hypothetical protein
MDSFRIDRLFKSFTSRSRIFHLYGDVTIAGEGLQNLRLYSSLNPFEQWMIFIVPHLLWHGALVFPVSSEGPPHLVAFYDTQGDVEDLFQPGSSRGHPVGNANNFKIAFKEMTERCWFDEKFLWYFCQKEFVPSSSALNTRVTFFWNVSLQKTLIIEREFP